MVDAGAVSGKNCCLDSATLADDRVCRDGVREDLDSVDTLIGTEGSGSEYGGMTPYTGVPFGSFQLVPMTRLNRVKASVELPEGRLTVEWIKRGNEFKLLVDVPNGVTPNIVMPDGKSRSAHARHQRWTCQVP